jgi:hypothetical protein
MPPHHEIAVGNSKLFKLGKELGKSVSGPQTHEESKMNAHLASDAKARMGNGSHSLVFCLMSDECCVGGDAR